MSMNVIEKIKRIEADFENKAGPFADVTFPEERLLDTVGADISLSMEDRLSLVSAFATFDYNRDANQLVDNLLDLHEEDPKMFNAWHVNGEKELEYYFEEIGFRYPSRDAHAWATNCEILRNKYHGRWSELLLSVGCDAETLVERLNGDDFLFLKGVKIAPMYARIIDDEVCDLDNLWALNIPVDTHIRRLSNDLFERFEGDDSTDDEIREIWHIYGERYDINRHVIDGALWHIGNKWDEWGEEYWEKVEDL